MLAARASTYLKKPCALDWTKDMKIAIMTQPLGKNYGGIMQAWALQQVLKRMGHEVVTIDRQPDQTIMAYNVCRLAYRTAMKVIGRRKAPINLEKHLPTILKHTKFFIAEHIHMSEPLYSTKQLKAHFDRENYGAVIVGSDQAWRPKYSPNIYNFFLDFLEGNKIKRIAYACSYGVDKWEFTKVQTIRSAELAQLFDAISVREDSGVDLCRKYLGVEAQHLLDPTLLLQQEDYEQLIGSEKLKDKKEGIFTYFLDKTTEKKDLAEQLSKETGESVFYCQAKSNLSDNVLSYIDDYVMPNPIDWLTALANAKYVLTDSFHGMVFAIVFRKPFYIIRNESRGTNRFDSLLSLIAPNFRRLSSKEDSFYTNFIYDHMINFPDDIVYKSTSFLNKKL